MNLWCDAFRSEKQVLLFVMRRVDCKVVLCIQLHTLHFVSDSLSAGGGDAVLQGSSLDVCGQAFFKTDSSLVLT